MSWGVLFGRVLTLVLVGQIGLILFNLRAVIRPKASAAVGTRRVSILVPARNEEANIERCLRSLQAQNYPDVEILILDDRSTDRTAEVVALVGGDDARLVSGAELPNGWTGKNWACHQLAQQATGEIFCFVDADTVLEPEAVSAVVATLTDSDVGLVACLLRSETSGVAEAALLPMVNYAVLGLFPAALVHRRSHPDFAVAFGPFLTITQPAYRASGGHAAHPSHVVDDVQLARSTKAAGYDLRLVNGTDLVTTHWYDGVGQIWRGFTKNAYGGIGYRPVLALFALLVLTPILVAPFARVLAGVATGDVPDEALLQVILLLSGRAITGVVGRDSLWTVPLYPVTILFWAATLAWSMVLSATGRSVMWKGRAVSLAK